MKNSCKSALPRIAITLGEPAGIGPELIVRIAQLSFNAELTVIGDSALLLSVAEKLKLPLVLKEQKWLKNIQCHQPSQLFLVPVEFPQPVKTGTLCSENAVTTLNILNIAHQLAETGKVDGIVTAPVHKANLNSADASFLGHTEYFARAANVSKVVMMLASGGLRITLATTQSFHIYDAAHTHTHTHTHWFCIFIFLSEPPNAAKIRSGRLRLMAALASILYRLPSFP